MSSMSRVRVEFSVRAKNDPTISIPVASAVA